MVRSSVQLLSLLGGALLVVSGVFVWQSMVPGTSTPDEQSPSSTSSLSAPHSRALATDSVTPSAENVAPSVRQRKTRLKKEVAATPSDTAARRSLANLLLSAHDPAAAAKHYRAYLDRRPRNRQAWLDLANADGAAQRWQKVLRTTREMLSHYPNDPAALYNAGAAANLGRYGEARSFWERAMAHDPSATVRGKTETALRRLDSLTASSPPTP